jgi:hypothetical protein
MSSDLLLPLLFLYGLEEFVLHRPDDRGRALRPAGAQFRRTLLFCALALGIGGPQQLLFVLGFVAVRSMLQPIFAQLVRTYGPLLWGFLLEHVLSIALLIVATYFASKYPMRVRFAPEFKGMLAALFTLCFQVGGGAFIVASVLRRYHLPTGESSTEAGEEDAEEREGHSAPTLPAAPGMGRLIGVLERLLVVLFAFEQAWAGLGMLLAAKSIARFKDLEKRPFAEYYLIGTLTSFLVAISSALLWRALSAHL